MYLQKKELGFQREELKLQREELGLTSLAFSTTFKNKILSPLQVK